jgi:hypothetical protein
MNRRSCCRRGLQWLGAATTTLALPLLSGCAGLGGPRVITLGETDLRTLLARVFPLQRRVMEVLALELNLPQLQLLPERNRLALQLALDAQDRLSGRRLKGQLGLETALRYEPRDASIRLNQVRVLQWRLGPEGVAGAGDPVPPATGVLANLGSLVAERLLEDLAIHRLTAERQAEMQRLGLAPGAVTVTARGVEITLARTP